MNGYQGDLVTFVWIRRRRKQRLTFCRTFHQFIQHQDADAVYIRKKSIFMEISKKKSILVKFLTKFILVHIF